MERKHTDSEYEGELEKLREQVLLMGARVEEMLELALRAFEQRDVALARRIIDSDRRIDQLELQIDERCLLVLAKRQPMASDLRFITTVLKVVTDLERIGDLCVNVAERVVELDTAPPEPGFAQVARIAEAARGMVHDALDAFVAKDSERAREILGRDRQVDAYYAQLFPEFLTRMMSDPEAVFPSTRLLSIGRYLERIADHATNIAEMVVFMVRGEDVRHPSAQPPPRP